MTPIADKGVWFLERNPAGQYILRSSCLNVLSPHGPAVVTFDEQGRQNILELLHTADPAPTEKAADDPVDLDTELELLRGRDRAKHIILNATFPTLFNLFLFWKRAKEGLDSLDPTEAEFHLENALAETGKVWDQHTRKK